MLRSDSGLGDLTRNFGSGLGLSALSQNLRTRRCVCPELAQHWLSGLTLVGVTNTTALQLQLSVAAALRVFLPCVRSSASNR